MLKASYARLWKNPPDVSDQCATMCVFLLWQENDWMHRNVPVELNWLHKSMRVSKASSTAITGQKTHVGGAQFKRADSDWETFGVGCSYLLGGFCASFTTASSPKIV